MRTKLNGSRVVPALLLGAAWVIAAVGCEKRGLPARNSEMDAGVGTGGSGSGESSTTGASSQGGNTDLGSSNKQVSATSSAGNSGKAGASGSGGTSNQTGMGASAGAAASSSWASGGQGGVASLAGSGGRGGTSGMAGSKGTGGSSGGQSATVGQPTTHRPQALSCVGVYAPPEPVGRESGCSKHADCTQGSNGRCVTYSYGGGRYYFFCVYDLCATDADCEAGKVCYCSSQEYARCTNAGNCRVDANCGADGACSLAYGEDCAGHHSPAGYYCHTPKDTCQDDSDCTGKDYCDYDIVDGRWECKSPNMNCVIG